MPVHTANDRTDLIEDSTLNTQVASYNRKFDFFDQKVRPCMAEYIGTLIFVFVGTVSVQQDTVVRNSFPINIAIAHGFTIALLVANFGSISGGHFNPAITTGVALVGGMNRRLAIPYIIAQLLGAMSGSVFAQAVVPHDVYKMIAGGGHNLAENVSPDMGVFCEFVLTTILVTTVLLSAVDNKNKHDLAPLAIGFAVAVDILAGISLTGASMNPARSFGPAVVYSVVANDSTLWTYHYVYWVGPMIGALASALQFKLILGSEEHRFFKRRTAEAT